MNNPEKDIIYHYSWRTLFSPPEPNRYNDLFYPIARNNFILKDGIIQIHMPRTHLYFPNHSNFVGKVDYPFLHNLEERMLL
jgi:hypothetical protein